MTDTLTKTEKRSTRRTIERSYTLYLYPKASVVLAKVVTKDTDVKRGKPITTWYLFPHTVYDKHRDKKSWNWIIRLEQDDLFTIVTAQYMNHYTDGCASQYPDKKPRHVAESGWKKVLDSGDFSCIARDRIWYDGMMYGPQGNPLRRAFRCDYVRGGLGSKSYSLTKAQEWLSRQARVKDLEKISVPYYNADTCGSYALEFTFHPSPRVFSRMCKEKAIGGFKRDKFIKRYLGIDKFRKDED